MKFFFAMRYTLKRLRNESLNAWRNAAPAKWSRTVLECSKIILEFSRTVF